MKRSDCGCNVDDAAAHHIIPKKDVPGDEAADLAKNLRKCLAQSKISINQPTNGVCLPN